jgi:hypothetical protein
VRRTLHYEHRTEPLLPTHQFLRRILLHAFAATGLMAIALGIGAAGYRWTEGMPWLDAFLNASMILGGMGPVDVLHTEAGKLFASFYALFSGVAFLAIAGILVAPLAHRLLHVLHLEDAGKG